MKITDEMLVHAAPHACDLWLDTVADAVPHQTASRRFEQQMARLLTGRRRRVPFKYSLIAAILAALTLTVGTFAAESEWIGQHLRSAIPPADGPDYTITESKPTEPVSQEHLALHNLSYAPELRELISGIDLYIGNTHPVDGYYGCEKHSNTEHFVSVSEKLTIQRWTCSLCGYKELSSGIETIKTCLTNPNMDDYTFCDHHETEQILGFENWLVHTPTEYTEWEEDRSTDSRTSPCETHNHFAHDQVEQVRYAITEYKCPDCPKIVPYAELERRTVCYTLTEGLTYAAEPIY